MSLGTILAFNRLLDLSDEDYEFMFVYDQVCAEVPFAEESKTYFIVSEVLSRLGLPPQQQGACQCRRGSCEMPVYNLFGPGPGTYARSIHEDLVREERILDAISRRNLRAWQEAHPEETVDFTWVEEAMTTTAAGMRSFGEQMAIFADRFQSLSHYMQDYCSQE